jgi:ribose/xylose/arabinose/galactoside ABC-type transport system permease subunit
MSTVRPDNPVTEDEVATGDLVPDPRTTRSASSVKSWAAQNYRQIILFGTFALMILIFSLAKPSAFLTATNIHNLVNAMPVLTMMAIGVTVVLVLGEFDLSVPNVASLAAVVIGVLSTQTSFGLIVALVLGAVVVGLAAGAVNGTAVGYGRAPAFIVTLAVGSICAGIELLVQSKIHLGQTSIAVSSIPTSLQNLTLKHFLGFDLTVWVVLIIAAIVGSAMVLTPWGRHVHAIGGNETAARLAGVPVRRTKVSAFMLTGLLAGIAGMLFTSGNGYFANALTPYLLPAYAAAFFGAAGVGRRGFSVPATLFGALYLSTLTNGLTVLNEPLWVASVVQGVVLFVAVLMARLGQRS